MSDASAAPAEGAPENEKPTAEERTAQVETLVAASELFARSKNLSTASCRQKMVAKEVCSPTVGQPPAAPSLRCITKRFHGCVPCLSPAPPS